MRLELYAPQARQVFVAGSFNGWEPTETALYSAEPGTWVRELELPPGKYEYLFLVDGQWLLDPKAKSFTPNPFGGQNCLMEVHRASP
ncbi:MAG: glycogen-binding domain-containing protein [Verrucomicrobiota bacterium]